MRSVPLRQVLAASIIAGAGIFCATPAHAGDSASIEASDWKFSQAVVVAHVGQPMTLQVSGKEGVHAIKSGDLGIPMTMIMPGKTATVTFTPKKTGDYIIHCAVPCGPGHENMAFTVHVVE